LLPLTFYLLVGSKHRFEQGQLTGRPKTASWVWVLNSFDFAAPESVCAADTGSAIVGSSDPIAMHFSMNPRLNFPLQFERWLTPRAGRGRLSGAQMGRR
jgi:hypothetical protein